MAGCANGDGLLFRLVGLREAGQSVVLTKYADDGLTFAPSGGEGGGYAGNVFGNVEAVAAELVLEQRGALQFFVAEFWSFPNGASELPVVRSRLIHLFEQRWDWLGVKGKGSKEHRQRAGGHKDNGMPPRTRNLRNGCMPLCDTNNFEQQLVLRQAAVILLEVAFGMFWGALTRMVGSSVEATDSCDSWRAVY